MKTKKNLFFILMFLPLLTTIIALIFLPEQIPAHYGMDGQVTRWGSKFETLGLPVFTIVFGFIMLAIAKYAGKQEATGSNNEKVTIVAGIATLLLFNGLTFYILYTSFHQVKDLNSVPVDINQLVFCGLGLCMVVLGNIMPKAKMNSMVGLRTVWSMKNEITWKKSQRFGGISFIIAGVLILIVSCLCKGTSCLMWFMGIMLATTAVDVFYTYRIAKKH